MIKGKRITARQRKAIDYITAYTLEHGRMPTRREIADHMALGAKSLSAVTEILAHYARWQEVDFLRARVRELEGQLAGGGEREEA